MKINKLLKKISKAPKALMVPMFITTLMLPLFAGLTSAANEVLMEGNTKSLNVTAGETTYKDTTSAKVDEVVQVQLWQHNREEPTGAKAKNTVVKFGVPNAAGKNQVITGTSSSDNGNTVTDTTNVNLSLDKAKIQYMPGTAKYRYNKGAEDGDKSCQTGLNYPPERCYATVKISDSVVSDGVNLDKYRGNKLTGCNAHHETVTIQVRVVADVVKINKYVRHLGQDSSAWTTETNAKPGDDLEYMIRYENAGNTELKNVVVADNMPKYAKYQNGTTKLKSGAFPKGTAITSNNIISGGINVGNYMPGAVGYVWFTAKIDPIQAYPKCGVYQIANVGIVKPAGMNDYYNTALVNINIDCGNVVNFECTALNVDKVNRTTFNFTGTGAVSNATITGYTFKVNGQVAQDGTSNQYTFQNDTPGDYTVQLQVKTSAGVTALADVCTKKITVEKQSENPVYSCDLLSAKKLGDRKVKLTTYATADGGAKIKRYFYNYGDGQTLTTDKNMVEHTYKKDGTYAAFVTVEFDVNGETKTATSEKCAAPIKFTSEENEIKTASSVTTLPNTGPGSVIAIFAAVASISSVAYYVVVRKS